jgi:hypothetical protein
MRTWLRAALGLSLGLPLALLTLAPSGAQTPPTAAPAAGPQTPPSAHMEIIHHRTTTTRYSCRSCPGSR